MVTIRMVGVFATLDSLTGIEPPFVTEGMTAFHEYQEIVSAKLLGKCNMFIAEPISPSIEPLFLVLCRMIETYVIIVIATFDYRNNLLGPRIFGQRAGGGGIRG